MRCVVINAAGFINSRRCEALLQQGYRVIGSDAFGDVEHMVADTSLVWLLGVAPPRSMEGGLPEHVEGRQGRSMPRQMRSVG